MHLTSEQLCKLKEIAARVQNERDRERFSHLIAELMALFEEAEQQMRFIRKPCSLAGPRKVA